MALWLIIGAKGHWLLKMVFISLSLYFGLAMWSSVENLLGWPTNTELPEKFRIYWVEIKEPNKITGDKGAIYLFVKGMKVKQEPKESSWLVELYPAERDDYRLHQVPYSLQMHKNAQLMQKGLRAGKKFYGTNKGKGGKGKGSGKGGKGKGEGGDGPNVPGRDGEGREGLGGSFDFSQEQGIMFYELPPPKLPEKLYE